MKSHRPPDAEPKKAKLDPHKMEAAEQTVGRAMGVSTAIGRHTWALSSSYHLLPVVVL